MRNHRLTCPQVPTGDPGTELRAGVFHCGVAVWNLGRIVCQLNLICRHKGKPSRSGTLTQKVELNQEELTLTLGNGKKDSELKSVPRVPHLYSLLFLMPFKVHFRSYCCHQFVKKQNSTQQIWTFNLLYSWIYSNSEIHELDRLPYSNQKGTQRDWAEWKILIGRRKQAWELLAKKKKKKKPKKKTIIFRTRHLVVDDGERTARVLPCGITFLPLRHGDRLPHCC